MTVIAAAVTKKDGVVFASDSELTNDFTKYNEGYSKVWAVESHRYVFGACGSLRVMQVIKHWTTWPYFRDDAIDIEEFVVKEIIPTLRETLAEHACLEVNKKTESFEGEIMMAWDDNLAVIDSSFSVILPLSKRYAIGSGQSEALGSLGISGSYTKNNVIEAARKASYTAIGVGGPIWCVSTKTMKVEKVLES